MVVFAAIPAHTDRTIFNLYGLNGITEPCRTLCATAPAPAGNVCRTLCATAPAPAGQNVCRTRCATAPAPAGQNVCRTRCATAPAPAGQNVCRTRCATAPAPAGQNVCRTLCAPCLISGPASTTRPCFVSSFHLFPCGQAAFGGFERGEPASFLFYQVVLDAAC